MRGLKTYIMPLLLLIPMLTAAQTGNNVSIGNGKYTRWSNGSFSVQDFFGNERRIIEGGDISILSDYSGNILLYTFIGGLWDKWKNQLVYRNDTFSTHKSILFALSDSVYILVTKRMRYKDETRRSLDTSSCEFVYHSIIREPSSFRVDRSEQVFHPGRSGDFEFIEDTIGGVWVVIKSNPNQFTSYYFNDSCLACSARISIVPNIYGSEEMAGSALVNSHLRKSASNNLIAEQSRYIWEHDPFAWDKFSSMNALMVYEINKQDGTIQFKDTAFYLMQDRSISEIDSLVMNISRQPCFSSNDSFLYFFNFTYKEPDQSGSAHSNFWQKKLNTHSKSPAVLITQTWANHGSDKPRIPGFFQQKAALFVNRKLYVYGIDKEEGSPERFLFMHEISDPGTTYNGNLHKNKYVLSVQMNDSVLGSSMGGYHKYNYIHIKPHIEYGCDAEVSIEDLCDYAFPDAKTTYWVEEIAGSGDLKYKGQNPLLRFDKNGDYLLKVVFKSDLGVYKEIHFDTLHIRIPPKPVAKFEASDTVVCRYAPLRFVNQSRTANIHPQKGEKWVWTFGDGNTFSTTNPLQANEVTHTYTQTGTFSVSLFYFNGYCDSTLVLNQYIRVVDAPKPGFSVDNQHGCTPFEVNFTDTVQLHVQKKEYFFSDEGQWREITNPHFTHTFQKAGNWFAVQRLYGFTGCITQTDTQFFTVKPGFTSTDTLHIYLATFQDNEHILIKWPPMPHAEAYQLHKSDGTISTDQNSYTHPIAAPALIEYRLQALDSCGNPGGMSEVERPVLLQGEVIGKNEAALLRFSPYLGQDELQYRILRDGSPLSGLAIPDSDLRDADYKSGGGLQACYLVEATSTDQWLSRSNTLCLPYIPALFLPNVFSPNGDGLNDVFQPALFGITDYSLSIYNRWGELIHQGKAWNGQNALPGAYFYTLEATDNQGKRIFLKGSVSVVR